MEEKKIPLPKYYASDLVKDALKNAELVLYYISEVGISANKEDISIITKAKNILENDEWTTSIEVDFWMAYKNLTRLIRPVTVDSLKASQETLIKSPNLWQKIFRTKRRETLAYRVVRFYTAFAVIMMIIMLALQIFFSIGTVRLNRIQAADERISKIMDQLSEVNMIVGNNSTNFSAQQKQQDLTGLLAKVDIEKRTNISMLAKWVDFIKHPFGQKNAKTKTDNADNSLSEEGGVPGPPGQQISPQANIDKNIEVIQQAQNYILVIGLYILPLFYGLLGALTYVLRDLSNQTHKMQYTKESNINHILRLILGTIAGLAVGVFWGDLKQQESFIVIRSLGPLLVAYVSGLTVEYIFTAIEKLVGSWLNKAFSVAETK
jgi:hypothetical protein